MLVECFVTDPPLYPVVCVMFKLSAFLTKNLGTGC